MSNSSLAYVGSINSKDGRDSDSWFTPSVYIESARKVLHSIDFDPFSSKSANNTVNASLFYTIDDNAFEKEWPSVESIWCNPPYSKGLCAKSIEKISTEFSKSFTNGIVLVNNATETKWFNNLLEISSLLCITNHRISFYNTDNKQVSGNTRGQCFFLLSRDKEVQKEFIIEFEKYGNILKPLNERNYHE